MTATAVKAPKAPSKAALAAQAKADKAALLAEYTELVHAKLRLTLDGDDLKVIAKKTPADLVIQIGRLRNLSDYGTVRVVAEAAAWTPEPQVTNNGGGNGARRAAAPKVSQAKLDYAASLLTEVWGEDEAAELIADLVRYDGEHISRMIDSLKTMVPITEGQARFMTNLVAQKLAPGSDLAVAILDKMDSLTKIEAKRHLDDLQLLPDYVAPVADGERPARRNTPEIEADGMYRDPATGDIYKVQVAVHGSGKLYAKKLVKLDEPVMKRGKEATHEFEMAWGAIMRIKPEWRMTAEDAKEFGKLYGCCCRCGLTLTDEVSIAEGLGPDCRKKGM